VVIVGMFYWISVQRMEDEAALWRAADELLTFLEGTGRKVEADDYILIHGNGLRPDGVEAAIQAIRAMPAWQADPRPIVVWRGLARGAQPGRRGGTAARGAKPTRALRARPTIPGCPTSLARAGTPGRTRS
jgi:hypothetical protein